MLSTALCAWIPETSPGPLKVSCFVHFRLSGEHGCVVRKSVLGTDGGGKTWTVAPTSIVTKFSLSLLLQVLPARLVSLMSSTTPQTTSWSVQRLQSRTPSSSLTPHHSANGTKVTTSFHWAVNVTPNTNRRTMRTTSSTRSAATVS